MTYEEIVFYKIGFGWLAIMAFGYWSLYKLPDIINPKGKAWRDKNNYDIP